MPARRHEDQKGLTRARVWSAVHNLPGPLVPMLKKKKVKVSPGLLISPLLQFGTETVLAYWEYLSNVSCMGLSVCVNDSL